ncbi:MAG: hypothetical protein MZW92_60270 [Comamonadaceae bacterium]|nr:hypothetical protein [Comamonadaceae bacterium]
MAAIRTPVRATRPRPSTRTWNWPRPWRPDASRRPLQPPRPDDGRVAVLGGRVRRPRRPARRRVLRRLPGRTRVGRQGRRGTRPTCRGCAAWRCRASSTTASTWRTGARSISSVSRRPSSRTAPRWRSRSASRRGIRSCASFLGGANMEDEMGPEIARVFPFVDFVVVGEGDEAFHGSFSVRLAAGEAEPHGSRRLGARCIRSAPRRPGQAVRKPGLACRRRAVRRVLRAAEGHSARGITTNADARAAVREFARLLRGAETPLHLLRPQWAGRALSEQVAATGDRRTRCTRRTPSGLDVPGDRQHPGHGPCARLLRHYREEPPRLPVLRRDQVEPHEGPDPGAASWRRALDTAPGHREHEQPDPRADAQGLLDAAERAPAQVGPLLPHPRRLEPDVGLPGRAPRRLRGRAAGAAPAVAPRAAERRGRIWIERFSPVYFDRASFPARTIRPEASYADVYPPELDLAKVAYFFDGELDDTLPDPAHAATVEWAAEWKRIWNSGRPHPALPAHAERADRRRRARRRVPRRAHVRRAGGPRLRALRRDDANRARGPRSPGRSGKQRRLRNRRGHRGARRVPPPRARWCPRTDATSRWRFRLTRTGEARRAHRRELAVVHGSRGLGVPGEPAARRRSGPARLVRGLLSGKESFSLAVLLAEARPDLDWSLLATDVDASALAAMRRRGPFTGRDIENLPADWRTRHLEPGLPAFARRACSNASRSRDVAARSVPSRTGAGALPATSETCFTPQQNTRIWRGFAESVQRGGIVFTGTLDRVPSEVAQLFEPVAPCFVRRR